MEILSRHGLNTDQLEVTETTLSEREAAASILLRRADITFGTRAIASEFGLDFISLGWEAFDFVIPRNIWFRHLFQSLVLQLRSDFGQQTAAKLGGYRFEKCGELIWGQD
jgi:molybdate-binding protein